MQQPQIYGYCRLWFITSYVDGLDADLVVNSCDFHNATSAYFY